MTVLSEHLYAGLAGLTLAEQEVDLGHGVSVCSTYAHLTAPYLMAFSPPKSGEAFHPAPWRAARGGFGFDITTELRVPLAAGPGGFAGDEALRIILFLMRLSEGPFITAPVVSDTPFAQAASSKHEPVLRPFEVESRIFQASPENRRTRSSTDLEWFRLNWPSAAVLLSHQPKLHSALQACDACTVRARPSSSLLAAWGALEQLFAPSKTELRYRTASNLAAYLEPRGPPRLETFKRILKLYDHRSAAAHSAEESDEGALIDSWVLLRNALMKIFIDGALPTQALFENLIFSDAPSTFPDLSWGFGNLGHGSQKQEAELPSHPTERE